MGLVTLRRLSRQRSRETPLTRSGQPADFLIVDRSIF
jgi:hypothetical protein